VKYAKIKGIGRNMESAEMQDYANEGFVRSFPACYLFMYYS